MNNERIKELDEALSADIKEFNPTFAEKQLLYSLKKYVDKRLELLQEELEEKNKKRVL